MEPACGTPEESQGHKESADRRGEHPEPQTRCSSCRRPSRTTRTESSRGPRAGAGCGRPSNAQCTHRCSQEQGRRKRCHPRERLCLPRTSAQASVEQVFEPSHGCCICCLTAAGSSMWTEMFIKPIRCSRQYRERLSDRLIADRPTDRPTDRPPDRPTDRPTDRPAGWPHIYIYICISIYLMYIYIYEYIHI